MIANDFKPSGKWLIGYDADCLVCMSSVQFLFNRDRDKRLFFTSLRSNLSHSVLPNDYNFDKPGTLFLYTGEKLYYKSDAVFKICSVLPFPWNLFSSLNVLPKYLRDSIYNLIASNRNYFNPDNESCPLPSKELKERIVW